MKRLSTYNFSRSLLVREDSTLDKGIILTIETSHGKEPIQGRLDYEGFRKYITEFFNNSDVRIARESYALTECQHFEKKAQKRSTEEVP